MNKTLIEIYDQFPQSNLQNFIHALEELELDFRASSMESLFDGPNDILFAMKRAIQICNNCGLPLQKHIKVVYLADNSIHAIKIDWKLSKLCYCLALMNGNPENPIVGRLQLELLKHLI